MQNIKISIVVTSIFHANKSLLALAEGAKKHHWNFIIVGDVSSPKDFQLDGADYYDVPAQKKLQWQLASLCPERHYTRKNIGYLLAMANGSSIIVETDDDNIPNAEFWLPRQRQVESKLVKGSGWANIYNLFTAVKVWPRGFPLEELQKDSGMKAENKMSTVICPVQQGLADENPDVDAVFRMTHSLPISFDKRGNFHLEKRLWCPFNSQNTTWFKEAFHLMYLPSYCTFRMTDIWRSFVAQRIMWENDWPMMFHDATVWQERNEHSLIRDFEQEVPGYLNNAKIRSILDGISLKRGAAEIGNNLKSCYEELIRHKIITDSKELDLLDAWLSDIKSINH